MSVSHVSSPRLFTSVTSLHVCHPDYLGVFSDIGTASGFIVATPFGEWPRDKGCATSSAPGDQTNTPSLINVRANPSHL